MVPRCLMGYTIFCCMPSFHWWPLWTRRCLVVSYAQGVVTGASKIKCEWMNWNQVIETKLKLANIWLVSSFTFNIYIDNFLFLVGLTPGVLTVKYGDLHRMSTYLATIFKIFKTILLKLLEQSGWNIFSEYYDLRMRHFFLHTISCFRILYPRKPRDADILLGVGTFSFNFSSTFMKCVIITSVLNYSLSGHFFTHF